MPGQQVNFGGKPFLTIVNGSFVQKVDKGTEGARYREYELPNGEKGSKYEIVYQNWEGTIRDIEFRSGDYGDECKIVFDDAIVIIPTSGRYFSDFAARLMSADVKQPLTLHPFSIEDGDRKNTGISVKQNGVKLKSAYWDGEKKLDGFPEVDKEKATRKTYWKGYFAEVEAFLVDKLSDLEFAEKEASKKEEGNVMEGLDEAFKDDLPWEK